ncbi:MAG: DUF3365 domain-containing protein [Bacteroidales bacterium]|nr:DUF3365 domain-containing protein [Bacteroidales bacterium]
MKKVIWNSLFIGLFLFLSCNNSSESDKTKDSRVKTDQEDVKDHTDNKKDLTPLEQGLNFAMQTQKVLAQNLMNEIKTQGTVSALTFCSAKAITLTDSMALALNVHIKRVSDKPRNPNNKANKQELAYITKSKELLAKGEEIKPEMTEVHGKMLGYYPIVINKVCMQCHGNQGAEVLPETLLQINKLYPNDKGIDYKINELRGIWVVEMNKK